MNAVTSLADHPYAQALAWALLHFLWQGALLGLAAMVCFRICQAIRERALCGRRRHAGRDAGGPDRDDDLDRRGPRRGASHAGRQPGDVRRCALGSDARFGPRSNRHRVTEPDSAAHGRRARDLDGRRRRALDPSARRLADGSPGRATSAAPRHGRDSSHGRATRRAARAPALRRRRGIRRRGRADHGRLAQAGDRAADRP